MTAMVWESEGSGAGELPRGAAAGGGDTWEVTSEDADVAGAGGCHGVKKRGSRRVAGQQGNPAGESSEVGIREGGG